jgi:hypothetical protein
MAGAVMQKTLQEVESLSKQERAEYWAGRPPQERTAAAWEMSKEHYRKLGLWQEDQEMDKSIFRIARTREEWLAMEEE